MFTQFWTSPACVLHLTQCKLGCSPELCKPLLSKVRLVQRLDGKKPVTAEMVISYRQNGEYVERGKNYCDLHLNHNNRQHLLWI